MLTLSGHAPTPLGQAESNAHFWIMSAVRSVAGFTLSSANLGPLPSTYVFQALHKASAAGGTWVQQLAQAHGNAANNTRGHNLAGAT